MRLRVPVLGLDAAIESVGRDAAGNMDVPRAVENVAWYNPGVRPGEAGNAAISGHLDDYRQQPAVFWRLGELAVGEQIEVVDEFGVTRRFEVVGRELFPFDAAPITRIFGPDSHADLNLITCNGIWDESSANYDQRLVIFTRLVTP